MWRHVCRISLGLFVLSHAFAHTVLLLRGEIEYPPSAALPAVAVSAFVVALIALTAAGVGILGSRVFRGLEGTLISAGLAASVIALGLSWNDSAWWGLTLDAVLVFAFGMAWNAGILLPAARCRGTRIQRARAWLGEAVACGLVAYVAVGAVIWPWHRSWGATPAERHLDLPGDRATRNINYELMHAVSIDAPTEVVWSWLVQLGQDRAGFYSYDWLERWFLADVHNVYEIRPEWQQRAVGDFVRAAPPDYMGGIFGTDVGWRVNDVDPGRALVLENWGAFVLKPDGPGRTRFFIRSSIGAPDAPAWGAGLTFALFELPHFVMERKMMLTIKQCAERSISTTDHASATVAGSQRGHE